MASTERGKIRLSLDVSQELYHLLESISERTDESKSDVLRKAIVLMDVAVKASQEGKRLLVEEPVTKRGERTVTEVVGLFPPMRQARTITPPSETVDYPQYVEDRKGRNDDPGGFNSLEID